MNTTYYAIFFEQEAEHGMPNSVVVESFVENDWITIDGQPNATDLLDYF